MFNDLEPEIDYEVEYQKLKNKNSILRNKLRERENDLVQADKRLAEYISDCDNLAKIIRGIRNKMDDPKKFDDMVQEIADEYESVKEFVGEYDD
jgi:hypothetical protein